MHLERSPSRSVIAALAGVLPALAMLAFSTTQAAAIDLDLFQMQDGEVEFAQFGFAVTVVGDMDGDGYAEYAVGASFDSVPGPGAGRVFVFRGGAAHLGEPPAWILSGLPGDLLGRALAPAGDQDGDDLADLLIGAPGASTLSPAVAGRALIAYGSTPLGLRQPLMLIGTTENERFGWSVATTDLDGDGAPEIAIGSPGYHGGAGAVHVYRPGPSGPVPIFTLHGREVGDEFGSSVAGIGATRGGSLQDLLIGAPFHSDEIFFWNGEAYLYLGNAAPDTVCDMTWQGADDADFMGEALSGAGDVDADTCSDFLIGSPGANFDPDIDVGRFDLFLGGALPPPAPALTGFGTTQYSDFGLSVAGIGDIDGDGYDDFAVGMPGSPDAMIAGEVHVHLGGTLLSPVADTVLTGEVIDDQFGRSISNGGPVLGGGADMFLVGSHLHDQRGRAYLFGTGNGRVGVPGNGPPAGQTVVLAPPWPNPGRDRVTVAYELPHAMQVSVAVVDVTGRTVATLVSGLEAAGRHDARWPAAGRPVPAGIYWLRLEADGKRLARRFVMLGK